jgi:hypothetical protein
MSEKTKKTSPKSMKHFTRQWKMRDSPEPSNTVTTTYKLPDAEYIFVGEITVDEVLEKAKSAAATTEHKYGVLVTEVTERRWDGLKKLKKL